MDVRNVTSLCYWLGMLIQDILFTKLKFEYLNINTKFLFRICKLKNYKSISSKKILEIV